MKMILLASLLSFSFSAMAAGTPVGAWHMDFVSSGDRFSPESLIEFSEAGVMTISRLMPKNTQKMVTRNQVTISAADLTFMGQISTTTCPGHTDEPTPPGAKIDYSVEGETLSMAGGQMKLQRATPAQIQKFAAATEGCQ